MPRILFADDDLLALTLFEKTAELYDCEAILACSGKEAIETALREKPDLVVVDLQMLDMDGLEVIRALKAEPLTADIPVVMLTAGPALDIIRQARTAGAAACLFKPMNFEDLLEILPKQDIN